MLIKKPKEKATDPLRDHFQLGEDMDLFSKLKEMKIMLIDDDEWIRDSLSLFFESEGCHLLALETAEEGLDALRNQNYDIIIVDYRLPGMDGLDFLEKIRESYPMAIRILITAYGSRDVISKALEIGIQDYISKPFTVDEIEQSLSQLIKNKNGK
jgi:DNA-binding response OmpR family regulator